MLQQIEVPVWPSGYLSLPQTPYSMGGLIQVLSSFAALGILANVVASDLIALFLSSPP